MTQHEVMLADILACLKEQKEEIKEAKEDTNTRLERFMFAIESNIGEVRKDVTVLNNIMEERDRENKEMHRKVEERFLETERERKEERRLLNGKMKRLEEALLGSSLDSGRGQEEAALPGTSPVSGRRMVMASDKRRQVENRDVTEKEVVEDKVVTEDGCRSSWSKNVEDELKEAAKLADRRFKEKEQEKKKLAKEKEKAEREQLKEVIKKKKAKAGMKNIKKWFGQESPDSSEVSDDSEASENEKDEERIDRKDRNRRRRKRNEANRKNLKAEVATKASKTIGCHPIKECDIAELKAKLGDGGKARIEAVKIFLRNFLQFNTEELAEIEIKDTKMSPKRDDTVYVAFGSVDTIKELHWRSAQIRNPAIELRNYVPPQFWSRYMHLSKKCNEYRAKNPMMKTQIRFSGTDVEIMLKKKEPGEAYKCVPHETIAEPSEIPPFEFNMKWNQRRETPLRRKLVVFGTKSADMEIEDSLPGRLVRQRSSQEAGMLKGKKQRLSAGSSGASGSSGSEEDTDI